MTATPTKTPVVAIDDRRPDADSPTQSKTVESMGAKDLGRRMADVQNLLFGDAQRLTEDRLDQIDDRHREAVEAFDERLRLVVDTFERKITVLQEEIRTRDREQSVQRRRAVSNIGDAIKDLAKDA